MTELSDNSPSVFFTRPASTVLIEALSFLDSLQTSIHCWFSQPEGSTCIPYFKMFYNIRVSVSCVVNLYAQEGDNYLNKHVQKPSSSFQWSVVDLYVG